MSVHQTRYYAVYYPCQGEYVLPSIYWFVYLLITSHSAYSKPVDWRPLVNAGKVSAAKLTDRKHQFFESNSGLLFNFTVLYYD